MQASLRILTLLAVIGCALCQQKAIRSRRIGVEGQILGRVLSDYDVHTRPPVRDDADHSAIVVITSVYINRIVWREGFAEVDLYLRQQWEDSRLSYEVDPREGLEEVSLPMNRKIWSPDTYFSNGKEKDGDSKERRRVVIEPSGFVRSSEGRTIYVPTSFGTTFPFLDTRSFKLRLSSYNYPLEDVVYMWANSPPLVVPVEVSDNLMDGEFKFEEITAGDCVGNYTIGTFSCVDVEVVFSGSTFSAFAKYYLPSILLIISSWFHFWVHGSWSVPRSISAALPFIIFALFFLFRSDVVNSSPGICCWMSFALVITFFSFLEYFIVILCGIRRSVRYVSSGGNHPDESPLTKETVDVAYDSRCASISQRNLLDVGSRIIFPVIFIIWLIIYFLVLY